MTEQQIPVSVEIEPSSSNGYAVWVKSAVEPPAVWWKWYGDELHACTEAADLGLATRQEAPSGERYTRQVNYNRKPDATANPAELSRYGYAEPPANA
jgi:hypothetical protein